MHPVLFRIGDFAVGTYGVLIVVGMLTGLALASWLARRRGLPTQFFSDLLLVLVISGFLGARLLYILTNWGEFIASPGALILSRQGFVFLGGFIAALGAGVWFARRQRVPVLEAADVLAPAIALGHAFGRIGCFLAGCCYGGFCTPAEHADGAACAVGVVYPLATDPTGKPDLMFNYAWQHQVELELIAPTATQTLPVIPVQLFESAGNFLLAALLVFLWLRRRHAGQIFGLYLILYSILRFGLEYLRGDTSRGVYFGGWLSTSQMISIATLVAGIVLFWIVRRTPLAAVAMPPEAAPAEGGAGQKTATPAARKKGRSAR